MKKLHILIQEQGTIKPLAVSDSLSELLWREELALTPVKRSDVRVRNLSFIHYDIYETSLTNYSNLVSLAESYNRMDKAISYYQRSYSAKLVNFIIGDISEILQNIDNTNSSEHIDIYSIPQLILKRLKNYFIDSFLVKDIKLSKNKHANIKYIDGTAEFHALFTMLDIALPKDRGSYQRQPVIFSIFGQYRNNDITFHYGQAKTDKDTFFEYDEQLDEHRQAYLEMITAHGKNKQGQTLAYALDQIAKEFIYDFA